MSDDSFMSAQGQSWPRPHRLAVSDSTLRYDLGVKARLYASHGIPEYWVIDLVDDRVVRHRAPSGGRYTQIDAIASGTLAVPSCRPGIELGDLW